MVSVNGIEVLATYYCPHTDEDKCNCKKPKTGMIDKALEDFPHINMETSFYAGDSQVDVELAKAMQLQMYHISNEALYSDDTYQNIQSLCEIINL